MSRQEPWTLPILKKLMALLQEINKSFGITILLVTHDPAAAKYSLTYGATQWWERLWMIWNVIALSNEQYLQEIYSRTR